MENERLGQVPSASMVIEGTSYNLNGDFAALAEAEGFFNLSGHDVNLAAAICNLRDPSSGLILVRQLLPCALHAHQPALGYFEVQRMIDRMVTEDDFSFVKAVRRMWPDPTEEQAAANANLCFDLNALGEGNEFFEGKVGLSVICAGGTVTLDLICRVFPCAVHKFRPELSLSEARGLMTVQSVRLVLAGLESSWSAASRESQYLFMQRLVAVASDEEKQELRFRVLAKEQWAEA